MNVRNAGAVSCAQFAQIFSADGSEVDKTAILQWVAGFSTAVSGDRNIVDVFPVVDTLEFVRFIAAETAKWARVVKASGAKVD